MPERRAKSVVLFIVEGTTEETALGGIFAKLLQNDRVKLDVVHGDITTKANSVDPRETVRKFVINELQRDRGYKWTDISRIVQICDTDGAFIPEDAVVEGSQDGRLVYEESRIVTNNVRGIRARNRRKSAAMWKLSTAGHLTYICACIARVCLHWLVLLVFLSWMAMGMSRRSARKVPSSLP